MFPQKPENLYVEKEPELPPPPVVVKQPPIQINPPSPYRPKVGFIKMIYSGLKENEYMDNKTRNRYESFVLNFKAAVVTLLIVLPLAFIMMHSGAMSDKYTPGEDVRNVTVVDKIINFFAKLL